MRRFTSHVAAELRKRSPFLALIALALAAITVPPAQAVWFQVLTSSETVTTSSNFPTAALDAEIAPTTGTPMSAHTPGPGDTPSVTPTPYASTTPELTRTPGAAVTPATTLTPSITLTPAAMPSPTTTATRP